MRLKMETAAISVVMPGRAQDVYTLDGKRRTSLDLGEIGKPKRGGGRKVLRFRLG